LVDRLFKRALLNSYRLKLIYSPKKKLPQREGLEKSRTVPNQKAGVLNYSKFKVL